MVRPPISSTLSSSGQRRTSASLHAGGPITNRGFFDSIHHGRQFRRSSHRYHTFPTPPLATPRDNREFPGSSEESRRNGNGNGNGNGPPSTSFPEIKPEQVGLYVGLVASAFALAQLSTNFLWGYLSDRIGRKPVLVLGTTLLAVCFVLFGFCKTYWQVIAVQIAMGMLNGNAAVVPTALGDLTDKSNQGTAFTWLPVIYSLGSISGPALGAARRDSNASSSWTWFLKPSKGSSERQSLIGGGSEAGDDGRAPDHDQDGYSDQYHHRQPSWTDSFREIFNRSTISLLLSYLIYQFSNISFNSLYPIFATAPGPTGRSLDPSTIGLSLSIAGVFTIVFQLLAFQPIRIRLGNLGLYRVALLGLAISMGLMPWTCNITSDPPFGVGTGKQWLYGELGAILIIKNISAVGALITNSAMSYSSLGTLNGIAQTISAAGRSIGPFLAGSTFSLSTRLEHKGEALAWGLFGGIALVGWLTTWGIDGKGLESDDWQGNDGDSEASV
ncbi:unnamed protein product [Parascedosporium putredinis]|uniref:Major facilitator superfamily (MFS) profile domain-containing protein n=1 Tax=Parascedosporium putredinis TaxID=1442378 RepID=A0A9P1M851_9PEZI|nr:unnamed protein product [Parascedosporium putredinis]CAI7988333.1 unnamed protein product [Parascedosporium putredinis]